MTERAASTDAKRAASTDAPEVREDPGAAVRADIERAASPLQAGLGSFSGWCSG